MKARHRLAALFSPIRRNVKGLVAAFRNHSSHSGDGTGATSVGRPKLLLTLTLSALLATLALGVSLASAAPPAVTIESASNVGLRSADAEGTVDPIDHETFARFQYVTDTKFQTTEWAEAAEAAFQFFPEGSGTSPIQAELKKLTPATTYHLRLLAQNTEGETAEAVAPTFTTESPIAPVVVSTSVVEANPTNATLTATVNPGGASTTYHFEYLTQAAFVQAGETFAGAFSTAESASIGSDTSTHAVSAVVSGLTPLTEYVYRVVATNSVGPTDGPTSSFSAPSPSPSPPQVCPNEPFRVGFSAGLPDCRAYEMVSPAYKGGQAPIGFGNDPPEVDANGAHIIAQVFAGFAGAGNLETQPFAEFGAIYEFSHTPAGWQAESLEPPASLFSRRHFISASRDFSRSLWGLIDQTTAGTGNEVPEPRGAGVEYDFAIREISQIGPRFVEIGPETPPGAPTRQAAALNGDQKQVIAGASDDLSHLLIRYEGSENINWSGDATKEGAPSLYEYVGTGNAEPEMVGVENVGPLNGTTHRNEHAELISSCGTVLGSPKFVGSTYNAISSDGTQIDFTALGCGEGALPSEGPEVDELFVRINGAETIDLSEPTPAQCAECDTPETIALGRRSAQFQGASADGSKVFFLSEQQTLPGAAAENLYEYDSRAEAGHHLTLVAPEVLGVSRVSEDGSHVYFVSGRALPTPPNPSLAQQTPATGEPNLYAFDTGTENMAFVGTLDPSDGNLWAHQDSGRELEATEDGAFLAFASHARLTPDTGGSTRQIFEYDATSGNVTRVSIGHHAPTTPDGYGDDGNTTNPQMAPSVLPTPNYGLNGTPGRKNQGVFLAADGTVVFTSRDALAPGAVSSDTPTNPVGPEQRGLENVYEYRNGNVFLISPADQAAPGTFESERLLGMSKTGQDIFFYTATKLVPQAADSQTTWYDARVNGGFPVASTFVGCAGESCQPPSPPSPMSDVAGSASFFGAGNGQQRNRHKERHKVKKCKARSGGSKGCRRSGSRQRRLGDGQSRGSK